jgi:hypothetical protein
VGTPPVVAASWFVQKQKQAAREIQFDITRTRRPGIRRMGKQSEEMSSDFRELRRGDSTRESSL